MTEHILTELCNSYTVSGNEQQSLALIRTLFPKNTDISADRNGNIIATIGNTDSQNIVLLDAHNDRIGFVVSYINENGFLKITNCGGIDRRVLLGSIVNVFGKEKTLKGIICCLPPHLSDGGEDKAPAMDTLYVDTGLKKADVEQYISVGDSVGVYARPRKLLGTRFTAGGIDNKAGVCTLIRVAELLKNETINCCVKIVLSVQEETGFLGSKTSGFSIMPDNAIVVDVSFARQPNVPSDKAGMMSKGTMIGTAPILDKTMFRQLKNIAVRKNLPYQVEVMNGTTGTNADVLTVTGKGIPTALLSIPIKNMHTQAEIVDLNDIETTAQLIVEYLKER